jgi:hypothetical protein
VGHDLPARAAHHVQRVQPVQAQTIPDTELLIQHPHPTSRRQPVQRMQRRVKAVGTTLKARCVAAWKRMLLQHNGFHARTGQRHRCRQPPEPRSDNYSVDTLDHDSPLAMCSVRRLFTMIDLKRPAGKGQKAPISCEPDGS